MRNQEEACVLIVEGEIALIGEKLRRHALSRMAVKQPGLIFEALAAWH